MLALENRASQNHLFALWIILSLCLMFSVLLWSPSIGARLNLLDGFISLPALLFFPVLLIKHRLVTGPFLLGLGLLLSYLIYGLISLSWADEPDISKTIRASAQVIGLYLFFSYLFLSGRSQLLTTGLFAACMVTALLCLWHLVAMYLVVGAPLDRALYAGVPHERFVSLFVQPINLMHATLLIAPQLALLVGLCLDRRSLIYTVAGGVGVVILVAYLFALERRTGQVALMAMLLTSLLIYRNKALLFALIGFVVLGVLVYLFSPEFILSRGTSWRPEIWRSTLQEVMQAPIFGHGVTNTVVPVDVYGESGATLGTFRHPHNMALSVLYFLGGVGLVLWALLWLPGLLYMMLQARHLRQRGYILIPLVVGATVLLFDGGAALGPFHYEWFCFWIPVVLMLSALSVDDRLNLRFRSRNLGSTVWVESRNASST